MPMYPSGHANPGVAAIVYLLDEWHLAHEDGTVFQRLPDPMYRRANGKESWSEDQLNALMKSIDDRIGEEVTRAPGTSERANATTNFIELPYEQKLALAQQLDELNTKYDEELKYLTPERDTLPPSPPAPSPVVETVDNSYDCC